jgi:FKBP-type peptidyl-prolyl cis-trans isomerase FkpA
MKKWFYVISLLTILISSCKKDVSCKSVAPTTVASAGESAYLQNYLTTNNITASQKNGMYYVINSQGTDMSPNLCSLISVTYEGKLINGTADGAKFDASSIVTNLNNLIAGWQVVLPLVKAGGTVTLYIPPSLGYGSQPAGVILGNGSYSIPANSYLKFVITLLSVS